MASSSDLQADRAIAKCLPAAWPAFFQRFGRLTEVQRSVIPIFLEGGSALVCSPTASGKTEAACAPIVERHYRSHRPWLILYVSPTRALVNDLYERLQQPLDSLSLRVARRTGDHRSSLDSLPAVLLTTPESFDSILCRGRHQELHHVLAHVVAVVLDEIHLVAGTPRGEQLRWLLYRLERLRRFALAEKWTEAAELQLVGLSATVSDPSQVARSYLGEDARLVEVPGSRRIDTVTAGPGSPATEEAVPRYLRNLADDEKILIFCNARRRVDELAAFLRSEATPLGYDVRAHHGSLSRKQRESAESAVKRGRRVLLVATSTLEIGVDIGDIDLVVLDGPAPDVAGLLQRIGRGNRRTGYCRVMACASSLSEVLIQSAMVEAARRSELGPVEPMLSYAVASQQIASLIFQGRTRARSRAYLQSVLEECASDVVAADLLDHMITDGSLVEDVDGIRLGDGWLAKAEFGALHSNIESIGGTAVVDEVTGDEIASGVVFRGGRGLQIGGRLLEARRWKDRKLEVRGTASETLASGTWGYRTRAWMKGAGQGHAVRRYLDIPPGVWPVVRHSDYVAAFHFGGGRRHAVVELLRSNAGAAGADVEVNAWIVLIPTSTLEKPTWLEDATRAGVELQLVGSLETLERTLARPLANRSMPMQARIEEVRNLLSLDSELEAIRSALWSPAEDLDLEAALRILLADLRP